MKALCKHDHPAIVNGKGYLRDWCFYNGLWYNHNEPHDVEINEEKNPVCTFHLAKK